MLLEPLDMGVDGVLVFPGDFGDLYVGFALSQIRDETDGEDSVCFLHS